MSGKRIALEWLTMEFRTPANSEVKAAVAELRELRPDLVAAKFVKHPIKEMSAVCFMDRILKNKGWTGFALTDAGIEEKIRLFGRI